MGDVWPLCLAIIRKWDTMKKNGVYTNTDCVHADEQQWIHCFTQT